MKICLLNETKSFLFHLFDKLITLFHFSPAGKKQAYLPLYACFWEKKGIMLQTLRGKQMYHVTNVGVEKLKLSRLVVQHNNEFKMKEIVHRLTSQ